ncbi:MAG: hypothetical protein ACPL1F_05435 [bacterium]
MIKIFHKEIIEFIKEYNKKYKFFTTNVLIRLSNPDIFLIGNGSLLIQFQDEDLKEELEDGCYELNDKFEVDINSKDRNLNKYEAVKEILGNKFRVIGLMGYTEDIEYIFTVAYLLGLGEGYYLEYKFIDLLKKKLIKKHPLISKFDKIGYYNGIYYLDSLYSKIYVSGWKIKDNEKIKVVINNLKEG